jgi:protein ImuB
MGLRRIGDLLALPRAGLARRFGEALLAELDAAFGRRADPREPIVPERMFETKLELFARADSSEQVLHGAQVLLARLVAWLAAQHAFVQRFRILMHHETRWQQGDRTPQATALEIALAEPSRDSAHLLVLLRERLAHVQLPAPTLELALQASDIVKRAAPNGELFPTRQGEDEGVVRLVERLQARLGADRVQRLCAAEDHRPERASALRGDAAVRRARPPRGAQRAVPAGEAAAAGPCARPVWLQRPEPLAERDARPLLDGRPLALLSGPERIESGWWDADLAERDYFIAEAGDGALVWIYRARLPLSSSGESGWFLHGRFG